jgi:phosphonate transport system substrate-binding protein
MVSYRIAAAAAMMLPGAMFARPGAAQDACPSRGQLDTLYCDRDKDLVAAAKKAATLPVAPTKP